jgi:hypothetical protein
MPKQCRRFLKEFQKLRMFVRPASRAYIGPELRHFRICNAHSDMAAVFSHKFLDRPKQDVADLDRSVLAGAEQVQCSAAVREETAAGSGELRAGVASTRSKRLESSRLENSMSPMVDMSIRTADRQLVTRDLMRFDSD